MGSFSTNRFFSDIQGPTLLGAGVTALSQKKKREERRGEEGAAFAGEQDRESASQKSKKDKAKRKALALVPGQNVLTDQTRLGEPITGRRRLQV